MFGQTQGNSDYLENLEEEQIVKYKEFLKREELYWSRRSREQWLKERESNSKFFYLSVMAKRAKNKITKLKDNLG